MNITKEDLISVGKGLVVALISAALTYLTTWITGHDFGAYTPVIVAVWGIVVNMVRKAVDAPVEKATGVKI